MGLWLHRATIPVGRLGLWIRRRRRALGWSPARLGTLAGVGPGRVRRMEAGDLARVADVEAVLRALRVAADGIDH